jgi:hypothetical protein
MNKYFLNCNFEQFRKSVISLNCVDIQDRVEQVINECNCERHYSNGELDLI